MSMIIVLAAVFGLMLLETRLSRRNERTLKQRGAVEPPDDVYRGMQLLYPLAFLAPALEGAVRSSLPHWWWLAGLSIFVAAKALKYWAIGTLGERWTFKVLVPPGSERTRRGPYRLLAHPNYVAVVGEIVGAALLLGGVWSGTIFALGFGTLILRRIRVEEHALSAEAKNRRGLPAPPPGDRSLYQA